MIESLKKETARFRLQNKDDKEEEIAKDSCKVQDDSIKNCNKDKKERRKLTKSNGEVQDDCIRDEKEAEKEKKLTKCNGEVQDDCNEVSKAKCAVLPHITQHDDAQDFPRQSEPNLRRDF